MIGAHHFRFGVICERMQSPEEWVAKACLAESAGYSTFLIRDHFIREPFGDQFAPMIALMAAADATTTLRVGGLVLDNDYRHPVMLAKEAATIDLLSEGRLDLGLGAGWMTSDYEKAGIPLDPVATRIDRLEEALAILRGLFAGGTFSLDAKHYHIKDLEGTPRPVQKPHPPFLLGGGGRRMLSLAAREADIVNVNFNLKHGRVVNELIRTGLAAATAAKVEWIKEAAGGRFDTIELSVTVFRAFITEDRASVAA